MYVWKHRSRRDRRSRHAETADGNNALSDEELIALQREVEAQRAHHEALRLQMETRATLRAGEAAKAIAEQYCDTEDGKTELKAVAEQVRRGEMACEEVNREVGGEGRASRRGGWGRGA